MFADLGYIWQKLAKQLFKTAGIQLITKLKRNMKQRLMPLNDRLMREQVRPRSKPLSISLRTSLKSRIRVIVLRSITLSTFWVG
ncbi:transposase [Microcoleus asticus]|uniref:transposase n=1 Tax=Microcoleus asticus TaxID=2815231 RepID=UPI0030D8B7A3